MYGFRTAILLVVLCVSWYQSAATAAVTRHRVSHRGGHNSGHHTSHKNARHHITLHRGRRHLAKARHHKRRVAHGRGIVKDHERLSMDDALGNLPAAVGNAFSQFKQAPSTGAANTVLEQLNQVYEKALVDKDTLSLACEDNKLDSTRSVRESRRGLMDVERQLTILQDRMQTLQNGMDRSLAEVEALRSQYEEHRRMCDRNQAHQERDLLSLEKDLPMAQGLVEQVTASCGAGGGSLPGLVECALPDHTFVTTFADGGLRTKIGEFSGLAEKFVALNLERAVRGSAARAASAGAFLQTRSFLGRNTTDKNSTKAHHHKHHGHQGTALLQKFLAGRQLSAELCASVVNPPTCESFGDNMETLVGNIEDLIDELKQRGQVESDHCRNSLEAYETQIKDLKRQSSDSGVALANSVAEQGEVMALRRAKRIQVKDVTTEVRREVADCLQQVDDLDVQMCSSRKIVHELDQPGGGFIGDCEVSEWVRGPCSKPCGDNGGEQNLTRQIISAPAGAGAAKCPRLRLERTCNKRPCPVDGKMEGWGEWSQCSRACGGGTRSRHRNIVQEAKFGGVPTAETMQEQLCNPQPCDADCSLGEWSEWSECSKQCLIGHRSRVKTVIRPFMGDGTCVDDKDPSRLQKEPCNMQACQGKSLQCASPVDLAVVLDASGSVGAEGFQQMQAFARGILGRIQLEGEVDDGAMMGVVAFGKVASVAQVPSGVRSQLETAIDGLTWLKSNTNTAQALAVTREMIESHGRQGVPAVAVVITDGMPASATLLATEISRLRDQGSRIVFVTVGPAISERVAETWVSWPAEENLLMVPEFASLDESKVTELLADICPTLA